VRIIAFRKVTPHRLTEKYKIFAETVFFFFFFVFFFFFFFFIIIIGVALNNGWAGITQSV